MNKNGAWWSFRNEISDKELLTNRNGVSRKLNECTKHFSTPFTPASGGQVRILAMILY